MPGWSRRAPTRSTVARSPGPRRTPQGGRGSPEVPTPAPRTASAAPRAERGREGQPEVNGPRGAGAAASIRPDPLTLPLTLKRYFGGTRRVAEFHALGEADRPATR